MLVVDTSAWIEMLRGSMAGQICKTQMNSASEILVPTIVQLELAKFALREEGQAKADELVAYTGLLTVLVLDTAIASHAAILSRAHKLHTTDAIIYASAQINDAALLTCDSHFEGLAGVEYVKK